jgi:hypothetical protein
MRPYRSVLPAFQAAGRLLWPLIGITNRPLVVAAACDLIIYGANQAIACYAGVSQSGESR